MGNKRCALGAVVLMAGDTSRDVDSIEDFLRDTGLGEDSLLAPEEGDTIVSLNDSVEYLSDVTKAMRHVAYALDHGQGESVR